MVLGDHAMAHSDDRSDLHEVHNQPHSPASQLKASLEKVKKQLSAGSGTVLLQGTLLKRSETLRKWNQRWFTLDSSTGKFDYRLDRGDASPRGCITFEADSTITISPVNFHGAGKYDGCCFYVGTPNKKEYFLCAENQVIARAWVATLRATALVLKAHRDAVNLLSGNGAAKLGTVAAVVAAANSVAKEAARDIAAEVQTSIKTAVGAKSLQVADADMDNLTIMKETLRVKDEELDQLSRELRARDLSIKELAARLSDTANAAEDAAAAALAMDKERKAAKEDGDRARKELDDRSKVFVMQLKAFDERSHALNKQRDEALQEAQRWQKELAKAREQSLLMQASHLQEQQAARKAFSDLQELLKARDAELVALKEQLQVKSAACSQELAQQCRDKAADDRSTHYPETQAVTVDTERAENPEEEQQEAVKSEVVRPVEAVPNEREVLIDTYSSEAPEVPYNPNV